MPAGRWIVSGGTGPLLQKDVRLVAGIAEVAGASPGAVLTAADAALELMNHSRLQAARWWWPLEAVCRPSFTVLHDHEGFCTL